MFCACDIIKFLSVEFYAVRVVHQYNLNLIEKIKPSYDFSDVFDMICIFSPTVVASVKGLHPRYEGQLNSIEQRTLFKTLRRRFCKSFCQ